MAVIQDTSAAPGVGDVGELYRELARRLEHVVRLDIRAPDAVIEDACQFAWSRLLLHRDRVCRDAVMSWLARTAVHEAFKLLRRDRRELPLEVLADGAVPMLASNPAAPPHELVERRDKLDQLRLLPERQQRVLWLQAFGLDYGEIAAHEGCTTRTVERQLLRARHRVRERDLD